MDGSTSFWEGLWKPINRFYLWLVPWAIAIVAISLIGDRAYDNGYVGVANIQFSIIAVLLGYFLSSMAVIFLTMRNNRLCATEIVKGNLGSEEKSKEITSACIHRQRQLLGGAIYRSLFYLLVGIAAPFSTAALLVFLAFIFFDVTSLVLARIDLQSNLITPMNDLLVRVASGEFSHEALIAYQKPCADNSDVAKTDAKETPWDAFSIDDKQQSSK